MLCHIAPGSSRLCESLRDAYIGPVEAGKEVVTFAVGPM